VPQDYALFPFLNARNNITFGLGSKRGRKKEIDLQVERLAHLLAISHLLDRDVRTLSGGEKQRIALARALAPSPRTLLLDEPMGSLDVRTSKYLRLELKRLHTELGITTIHVTHNLLEARELADRLAILNAGRVEQVGTLDEVFFYPQSEAVTDFIGTPNVLDVDYCTDLGHGLTEAVCGGMPIIVPYDGTVMKKIALFPRDIYISTTKPPGPQLNRFEGTVLEIQPFSSLMQLKVGVGNNVLLAELPKDLCEEMDIRVGRKVFLILKLRSLRIH
jgi:ABC-type Fe3+/spermidine/putrescine transport system ATPase subunit